MSPRRVELKLTPAQAADPEKVRRACARRLKRAPGGLQVVLRRRSIDARRGRPKIVLVVDVYDGPLPPPEPGWIPQIPPRLTGRVIIVGAGPAGYFAALELLLLGVKPVVVERGKDTRARRYDLRAIMQDDVVHPHSNYCFGEGGAGTYSDGKLYTRAVKRGNVDKVMRLLVEHGAPESILVDTHPHIGSDKLPGVVENIRGTILEHGGEIHFEHHVTDLLLKGGRIQGVVVGQATEILGDAVILATGHSARDVFQLLSRRGVAIEPKPFALGVRVEHPQELIDEIQYRQCPRDGFLPPSSYRIARKGVYSFCMCPGGVIVPTATSPGEIVVNGMSSSGRKTRHANSGVVTEVLEEDLAASEAGPLAYLSLQAAVERAAFAASGDDSQKAPAQLLLDFLDGRPTTDAFPACSYAPGLVSSPLSQILPARIYAALKEGLEAFGRAMVGYRTQAAVVVGVESRTSSPVRIPRTEAFHHPQVVNLFPCGEGAGYAGGIVSAAMDGQKVAQAVVGAQGYITTRAT